MNHSHQKTLTTAVGSKKTDNAQPSGGFCLVERRKHPRVSIELPIDYSLVEKEESIRGIVEDASEGGLLVYVLERIEVGALLRMDIFFPRGLELTRIQVIAKVIWFDLAARERWGEYRYGIQFLSFYKGDLSKLKILLKEVGQANK